MAKFKMDGGTLPAETVVEWKGEIDEDGDFAIFARNPGGEWYSIGYISAQTGELVRICGVSVKGLKLNEYKCLAVDGVDD